MRATIASIRLASMLRRCAVAAGLALAVAAPARSQAPGPQAPSDPSAPRAAPQVVPNVPQAAPNAPQAAPDVPLKPGGIRLRLHNPEPGNWITQNRGGKAIFICKPLACAAASQVEVSTGPTPARDPDPQALEHFAKVQMPKLLEANSATREALTDVEEKLETLQSTVSTQKGFPSVLNETKATRNDKVRYITSAMIFAGPALISVQSVSTDRAVALKSLNIVIGALTIEEGPPLTQQVPAPAMPAPPPAVRPLTPSAPERRI